MGNRGQKRVETVDDLPPPADKRACNLQENRASTSSSSSAHGQASSSGSVEKLSVHHDMDDASYSSGSSHSDEEEDPERVSAFGSCEPDERALGRKQLKEYQRQRSSSDHDKFAVILSSLNKENKDASEELVLLTDLCEVLSFCTEQSISTKTSNALSPHLVKLASEATIPDIVLLAIRAMTYMCDLFPPSSGFLVRDNAVSVLCQKLMAIEDMDVAEQCLQAMDKISVLQPLACFQAGAIMAVLSFIDFFSTSIQRVALSTVMNICRKLPAEPTAPFLEAVPILINLLQYEDKKLAEIVAVCLIRITERVHVSAKMLDELHKNGLIQPTLHLLDSNSRTALPQHICYGLLGVFTKLSWGSVEAFKTLYELNISRILKDILTASDLSHGVPSSHIGDGQCNQVYGVLKLLDMLLPISNRDQKSQMALQKENFLVQRTEHLQNLGRDIIPLLVQMINSGANSYTCYGGLCIIKKLIHLCTSDIIVDLLKIASISSFLASLLTRKDPHVLSLALQTIELILQKVSNEFMHSFVKEGVVFSIDALLVPEKCPPVTSDTSTSQSAAPDSAVPQSQADLHQKAVSSVAARCLCYAFAPGNCIPLSEGNSCKLEKDSVNNLAKHIRKSYFSSKLSNSDKALTGVLQELRTFSTTLSCMLNSNTLPQHSDMFYNLLRQIVSTLNGTEIISTFEFVESGIVRSLVDYLSDGQKLRGEREICADHDCFSLEKRVKGFARLFLLSSDQMSQGLPLSTLVQKLQNGLSSMETFPVILSNASRIREAYANVPTGHYTRYPCPKVCFVRGEGETNLREYPKQYLAVDSLSSMGDIEGFLWPNVHSEVQTHVKESGSLESDVVMTDTSEEIKEVSQEELHLASPKLVFFLDGQELDRELTLYQAILQKQMKEDEAVPIGIAWWTRAYTLSYRKAENQHLKQSSYLVQKSENPSPTDDILHLLKWLDTINRSIIELISQDRVDAFARGELDDLDALNISVQSVSQFEFVNTKLTEKLEQQMRDSMAMAVGGMPTWCSQLVSLYPFLFSFEARCKFFRLDAFGQLHVHPHQPSHSDSGTPTERRQSFSGFPRKKFLVSRNNILESATQMMELHASHKVSLEIEYKDEVGTGLGPTLEFYTLVSRELQKSGLGMWRDDHGSIEFVASPLGLFPRPWSSSMDSFHGIQFSEVIKKYVLLGQIVAKALQDGRVLDLHFSKAFYKLILGQELGLFDILSFDPGLGRTMLEFMALVKRKQYLESTRREISFIEYESCFRDTRIEDLCLDFTLPGYPNFLLASGLEQEMVSMTNLEEYVSGILDATLRYGISEQLEAFKSGFNQVFSIEAIQIFTEAELERLLCGEHESWTVNELLDHVKFDHGYTASSPPIVNLLEIILAFNKDERRAFLQFVTGTPRLPLGGFASLNPKLTIVRKHSTVGWVDADLPSVMTCANYLKLPPYSSKETMKDKLIYAITEGQGSFHLS